MISTVDTAELSAPETPAKGDGIFRMPLNLERIAGKVPAEHQQDVIWFHQYSLEAALSWNDMAKALSYDRSTISRIIMCVYVGSWANVADRIRSYRKILQERSTIQRAEFRENVISKQVFASLNFALINADITLIVGESGIGKTACAQVWRERNNHGRSILVEVPPMGGPRALLRQIAKAVGVNSSSSSLDMLEACYRAFNPNRILILDEVFRLLPSSPGANPVALETIRSIHDKTGCALGFLATQRFQMSLTRLAYQFEQVIGRIGLPCPLPAKVKMESILPILAQYIPKPSAGMIETCLELCNQAGHFRNMVKSLQLASRIANKAKAKLTEDIVFQAIKIRKTIPEEKK